MPSPPRKSLELSSLPAALPVEHVHGILVLVGPPVPEQILVRIHLICERTAANLCSKQPD